MALTSTTLAGAITASALRATLTSGTGLNLISPLEKKLLMLDGELLGISSIVDSPTVSLVRGIRGTLASAHAALTPAIFGSPIDFADVPSSPWVSYSASGAIAVPTADQVIYLTKATAAAMTLANPAKDCIATVVIYAIGNAAHTVTYTAGFYGNTTSSDVATFTGTGSSMTIRAANGLWGAIATAGVTIA